jgi:hypothetical protein
VTVNIFLRELRPYWAKADPNPLPAVEMLARKLKISLRGYDRRSLLFARVEAGLIRQRRSLREPRLRGIGDPHSAKSTQQKSLWHTKSHGARNA